MGTWKRLADMPAPRFMGGTAAVDGKLYFIGGAQSGYSPRYECYVYDVQADAWSRIANLPEARHRMGVAVYEGKLYSLGGYNGRYSPTSFVYDIATNRWSNSVSDMPKEFSICGFQQVGEKVYLHSLNNETMVYDIPTDSWTLRESGPYINEFGCAGDDGSVYYFGGRGNETTVFTDFTANLYRYDVQADGWLALEPMSQVRGQSCGVVNGGRLYCIGGYQEYENGQEGVGQKGFYNPPHTAVYNLQSGQWKDDTGLPEQLSLAGAVTSGGKVYVMGGIDYGADKSSSSLYEYQPGEEGCGCAGCEQVTIKITGSKCSQLIQDVCKLVQESGAECDLSCEID